MFDMHPGHPQALYYKPSYERLEASIRHACPDLDVALIDEQGQVSHHGEPVSLDAIRPTWFWIHSELFKSPVFKDYCRIMLESESIQWLHTINTGLDKGPYLELLRRGVTLSNNHAQAIAIAEYVMGHVLSRFQNLPDYAERQRRHEWQYRPFREIGRTRWLLVGFGHIGQQIARRAKAFGVDITAVRRGHDDEGLADRVCDIETMDGALAEADVVVLACASNDSTRQLVDAGFLGRMKVDAVLVNIARGDLVVEADLKQALDAGRPAYAILDVFEQEPLPADAWFWDHPKVSLTPHCSNGGSGMRARSDELFLENLYRMANGQLLLNKVGEKDIL